MLRRPEMLDLQCLWDPVGNVYIACESRYIMGVYLWSAVIFLFKTSQTLIYSEVVFVVVV